MNIEALRSFSEEDLICPLCHDIFINPVLLSCSHNVCEYCVRRFWEHEACKACPVCQRRTSMDFPPVNLALKNRCETFIQEKRQKSSSGICSAHKGKLKLFCLDDQEPVCLVCRDSKKHINHRFCPLDEAAMDNKETLKAALKPLQEKLRKFENVKQSLDQTAQDIKIKAQQAERQIKTEFEELHQFLRDEEAARITALREEEKRRSQMMKQKIEETSRQISSLTRTIRDVEEQMIAEDFSFLKNFKSTLQRTQCQLLYPEKNSVMIDFTNHLGNLKLNVLKKMQTNVDKNYPMEEVFSDPPRVKYNEQKCVTAFGVKNSENSMRQQHQSRKVNMADYSSDYPMEEVFSDPPRVKYNEQKCVTAFGVKNSENSMRQQHQSRKVNMADYSSASVTHLEPGFPVSFEYGATSDDSVKRNENRKPHKYMSGRDVESDSGPRIKLSSKLNYKNA